MYRQRKRKRAIERERQRVLNRRCEPIEFAIKCIERASNGIEIGARRLALARNAGQLVRIAHLPSTHHYVCTLALSDMCGSMCNVECGCRGRKREKTWLAELGDQCDISRSGIAAITET